MQQVAHTLEHQAGEIARRWYGRARSGLYADRQDLAGAEIYDSLRQLVTGTAEALRREQPEAPAAPWMAAARSHAA